MILVMENFEINKKKSKKKSMIRTQFTKKKFTFGNK